MRLGQHGLDGFEQVLRFDLAGLALVGAGLFFHDRDAVLAVAVTDLIPIVLCPEVPS